ncbi:MAG TPA: DUF2911 domain-containing protein [Gemmatimonadaceae bacterium]|nr:DUF2911 domain-containing protein [Gemmatimonadaceae bacterium]
MKRLVILALILSACTRAPSDRYGFVALLGRDTVSVERIDRYPGKLISDEVDRFPAVRIRHTELLLASDGAIRHLVMDVRTPNAGTSRERARRITADFTSDSVLISIRDSTGVKDTAFATGGALTVPHVSMMYSVIELELAAAIVRGNAAGMKAGDSIAFRQFYPDRDIGESFVLHSGWIRPLKAGEVELWHDWLAGIGDAMLDAKGHMLSYSGERSTYKVAVGRTAVLPDVETIGARFAETERRGGGTRQLSVRDTARATFGGAAITVDYARPLARGRVLLGNVITYDDVWRTGANAATQFTTSKPVMLDGLALGAGTYSLWTVPHRAGVDLIVNKESGQWGTEYNPAHNLGTAPLGTEEVGTPVEKFTISVIPSDSRHGSLVMEWGTFRWTAPIAVR